ncbi:acyltransferase [Desertihabitans brevis]|uniref:Acyltransferase n=1 Tax=Desertihabitans brevis TaxID=2268447 RepID=A0A367YU01_9ACTN|nr:acyltransferase [Desertihabitans brevis]
MDALRAGALLLGIVLHTLMPFVPGIGWLVVDSETSVVAGIPVMVIHLFRMHLFMMLAGYLGRMVLHRRGPTSYLRDRTLRILLPLVAFWAPAVLGLGLVAGAVALWRGTPPPQPPPTAGPPPPLAELPPGQLWFLAVLMQCVLVVVVVRAVAVRLLGADRAGRVSARLGAVLVAPAGVLLAALPYLVALLLQGMPEAGIAQPLTVLPQLVPLTAYLGAFLVGWWLHASSEALQRLAGRWRVHLGLAVLLSAALVLSYGVPVPEAARSVVVAAAGWLWVYGLVGLCVRHLDQPRPAVRYLADASYWMYLVHLPLVVAVEGFLLADLTLPIVVKLVLTWALSGVLMVASYDLLVRSTWVGRWLNGHRRPRVLFRRRSAEARTPAA